MYDIYVSHFDLINGANVEFITSPVWLCSYPREAFILDQENEHILENPKIKGEMGKAGSFEFSIYPDSLYYSSFRQMMTMFRVDDNDETIFYGRVLTIDTDHITGKKSVHCEGYLATLMDTQIEGQDDNDRPKTSGKTYIDTLISNHNSHCRDNTLGNENPPKQFEKGILPGYYSGSGTSGEQRISLPNDTAYGTSGWQDTASAFNTLVGTYGGYLRARYSQGSVYLDWMDSYFRSNNRNKKPIRVRRNVISMSSTSTVDNLFTYLVPIGSKKGKKLYVTGKKFTPGTNGSSGGGSGTVAVSQSLDTTDIDIQSLIQEGLIGAATDVSAVSQGSGGNTGSTGTAVGGGDPEELEWKQKYIRVKDIGILSGFSENDLNEGYRDSGTYSRSLHDFGVIYKNVTFSDVEDVDTLWTRGWEYIRDNYFGYTGNFTATAVDLGIVDPDNYISIQVGDQIRLSYFNERGTEVLMDRTVISIEYDLQNPENNQYTIGIPSGVLNNPNSSKHKGSKKASKASAKNTFNDDDTKSELERYADDLRARLWIHYADKIHNNDTYEEYRNKYGDDAAKSIQQTAVMLITKAATSVESAKNLVAKMIFNTHNGTITLNRDPPEGAPYNWGAFSDRAKTFESVVIDGVNGALTMKEKINLTWDGATDSWQDHLRNPKPILQLKTGETNTTDGSGNPITKSAGWLDLFKITPNADNTSSNQKLSGFFNGVNSTLGAVRAAFTNNTGSALESLSDGENVNANTAKVFIDGTGTDGEGSVQAGKKSSGDWRVTLNNRVQYKGADGVTHTFSGFVTCADVSTKSIDSFNTKFAIIDTLFAGVAYISDLNAVRANIERITGNTIIANTRVYAADIRANTIMGGDIRLRSGSDSPISLWDAGIGFTLTENQDNTVTLKLVRANSSEIRDAVTSVTFNRAAALSGEWSSSSGEGGLKDTYAITAGSTSPITLPTTLRFYDHGATFGYFPSGEVNGSGWTSGWNVVETSANHHFFTAMTEVYEGRRTDNNVVSQVLILCGESEEDNNPYKQGIADGRARLLSDLTLEQEWSSSNSDDVYNLYTVRASAGSAQKTIGITTRQGHIESNGSFQTGWGMEEVDATHHNFRYTFEAWAGSAGSGHLMARVTTFCLENAGTVNPYSRGVADGIARVTFSNLTWLNGTATIHLNNSDVTATFTASAKTLDRNYNRYSVTPRANNLSTPLNSYGEANIEVQVSFNGASSVYANTGGYPVYLDCSGVFNNGGMTSAVGRIETYNGATTGLSIQDLSTGNTVYRITPKYTQANGTVGYSSNYYYIRTPSTQGDVTFSNLTWNNGTGTISLSVPSVTQTINISAKAFNSSGNPYAVSVVGSTKHLGRANILVESSGEFGRSSNIGRSDGFMVSLDCSANYNAGGETAAVYGVAAYGGEETVTVGSYLSQYGKIYRITPKYTNAAGTQTLTSNYYYIKTPDDPSASVYDATGVSISGATISRSNSAVKGYKITLEKSAFVTSTHMASLTVKAQDKDNANAAKTTIILDTIDASGVWDDGGKTATVARVGNPTVPNGTTPTELAWNTTYLFKAQYKDASGSTVDSTASGATMYIKTKADPSATTWNNGGKTAFVTRVGNPTVPNGTTPTELASNTTYLFKAQYKDSGGSTVDSTASGATMYIKTKKEYHLSLSGNVVGRTTEAGIGDTATVTVGASYVSANHNYSVNAYVNGSAVKTGTTGTEAYNGGWTDARALVDIPNVTNTSSDNVTITYPSTVVGSSANKKIYVVMDDPTTSGSGNNIKYSIRSRIRRGSASGTSMAAATKDITSVYTAGFTAGKASATGVTPTTGSISIGSFAHTNVGPGSSSSPTGGGSATELSTLATYARSYKNQYAYFKVTVTGSSITTTTKWYYFALPSS